MLHTKVKTEKPDLETANARTRLDAVLQCLLEKTDVDREQIEEDSGKTASDALCKDSSPTATGKRPSARFSHHRRKKRKETDDGLTESGQQKQNTYVIKLFDRSVDLAQFSENTPLYPICRAWMKNSPTVREQERSPSPQITSLPEDEEGTEGLNGKIQDVFKMPPPTACQANTIGEPVNLRIPSPLEPEEETKPVIDMVRAPESLGTEEGEKQYGQSPVSNGRHLKGFVKAIDFPLFTFFPSMSLVIGQHKAVASVASDY